MDWKQLIQDMNIAVSELRELSINYGKIRAEFSRDLDPPMSVVEAYYKITVPQKVLRDGISELESLIGEGDATNEQSDPQVPDLLEGQARHSR